jgi:hypothetical protein
MLWNSPEESWRSFAIRCHRESAAQKKLTLEMQADDVVKVHNAHNGSAKTGRHFNPSSVTEANRLKANEYDLSSYMKSKDALEMLPYLLAAMTDEAKLMFASQYLKPAGLTVHLATSDEEDGYSLEAAVNTQIAVNQACSTLLDAAMNPTPQNIDAAEREAVKVIRRFERTRAFLAGARKIGARLGQAMKRKEAVQ